MKQIFARCKEKMNTMLLAISAYIVASPAIAQLPKATVPGADSGDIFTDMKAILKESSGVASLTIAAIGLIVVAIAAITVYKGVTDGKKTWGDFGATVVVGILMVIAVVWALNKAMVF